MAAMGGSPLYLVISLGLPRTTSFSSVKSFFRGVESAVNPFKVKLVGGDTVRSQRVVADTCVIGVVRAGGVLRRMGAKPGDLIFATGAFGYSFSTGWHYLFQPRIKEMEFLKKRMKITSAIDASDGLYASLRTLSRESRVFFRIDASKIRFRKKQRSFRASFEAALFDGEDFELVFTGRCWNFDRLSEQFQKSFQVPLSVIGRVEAGQGMRFIDKEGWNIHVRAREFQHFKK
ncbi:MAG: thiamine-monophosphate kinase, partial [Candidatus Aureabacteria bacterium]|nr:thiamine-monophosphate kinase [Candidatus Auribacterota bacterium]